MLGVVCWSNTHDEGSRLSRHDMRYSNDEDDDDMRYSNDEDNDDMRYSNDEDDADDTKETETNSSSDSQRWLENRSYKDRPSDIYMLDSPHSHL